MKGLKKYSTLVLSFFMLTLLIGCGQQAQTESDAVENINEKSEDRVVALSVSLVEILEKLDVELVGVPKTQYKLSEKMSKVTQVGLPMSPDVELIASLKPTHVLSVTGIKSMLGNKLEQAGIEPIYLNMDNIDTMKASIIQLGELFDRQEKAQELVASFDAEINETIESVKEKESPKVLILFGFPGSYLTATPSSFVGQLVEMLGGENVVSDTEAAYIDVNLEALLQQKPDVILRMTHGMKDEVLEMFDKEFKENPIWSQFEAVQQGKVYDLDDSLFNVSASLKTSTALKELADILYK